MWFWYALISAVTAALVAVFGKLGLRGVDPTIATTIRAVIMAGMLVLFAAATRRSEAFGTAFSASGREWLFVFLAALAGALSWLTYFSALKTGMATKVVAIDRLSIVFAIVFAALILGEALTWKSALGAVMIAGGAIIIAL